MQPAWELVTALLGGTTAMRAAGKKYLPRHPAEEEDAYAFRLSVSTLYGAFAKTVTTMAGKPFAEPLQLGADMPPKLVEYCEDIDLEGRDLQAFAHTAFAAAMGYGLTHILVDYPRAEGTQTLAEQRAIGARPYFVHILAPQVLGWRAERINGVHTLTQLRFVECVSEPDGEWGESTVEQVRVLEPGAWRIYRKSEKGEWFLHEEGTSTLGVIPLVTIYTGRTGFMTARPPLMDLAHLNVEHWQSASDQQNILRVARVPILLGAGFEDGAAIKIGATSAVQAPSSDAKLMFVEHSGKAIEAGRQSLQDLEERMSVMGAELLVSQPGQKTATESATDTAESNAPLSAMARNLEDAIEQALDLAAKWEGLDRGGEIELYDGFAGLEAFDIPSLLNAKKIGVLSAETVFAELQRRGLIDDAKKWADELARIASEAPQLGIAGGFLAPPVKAGA